MNGLQEEQRQELSMSRSFPHTRLPRWQSLYVLGEKDGLLSRGEGAGRDGGLATSDVEAFTAATRALDIRVVEDKFTGQL